jgi:GAF domain-containing protein
VSTTTQRVHRYRRVCDQLEELVAKTRDALALRASAVALLHHKIPGVSWTGFYMLRKEELVVDAYQGPVACPLLPTHTGVCWAGIDRRESILVADVETFPGHIPCDSRTRSEVVVPVFDHEGRPIGVLDVDSHRRDHFDDVDREGYESVVRLLERVWSG